VIILKIVDVVRSNIENAAWHVVKGQVIVFNFFSYALVYAAELKSAGTVVMSAINAV
jgi:hypothetical protein